MIDPNQVDANQVAPTEIDQAATSPHFTQFQRLHALSAAVIVVVALGLPLVMPDTRGAVPAIYVGAAALAIFSILWHLVLPPARRGRGSLLVDELVQTGAAVGLFVLAGAAEPPLSFSSTRP
ncbi:MAG: hypothetical protein EXR58_00930 [Chloroflexi bacterium]|nr:hypothetical protein [Chloroflexota bacterium]